MNRWGAFAMQNVTLLIIDRCDMGYVKFVFGL